MQVTAVAADPQATVTGNGTAVSDGFATVNVSGSGTTTITVSVTAADGTTSKTYTLTIQNGSSTSNAHINSSSITYAKDTGGDLCVVLTSGGYTLKAIKNGDVLLVKGEDYFVDVKDTDWFYGEVAYAHRNGLFAGTSETTFSPQTPMTRGILATVLWNLRGKPESSRANPFTNLTADWYRTAVTWAAESDIVSGYGGGLFGPDDIIMRGQMTLMLYRYAGTPALTAGKLEFYDAQSVSDWAQDALIWAVTEELIAGKPPPLLSARRIAQGRT